MTTKAEELLIVTTTCENREDADRIAEALLASKLAACVQAEPIYSRYRWDGEIQRHEEIRISMKCRRADYDEVERLILKEHPYDVPEIVATGLVDGYVDYLDWVKDATERG